MNLIHVESQMLLSVLFILSSIQQSARALRLTSGFEESLFNSNVVEADEGPHLTTLIRAPDVDQPEIYVDALRLLTSLESSPSCTRLATVTLLTSCQALTAPQKDAEGSSAGPEAFLDEVRSIYAARLAVCELLGAHAGIPSECSPLMPLEPANSKRRFQRLWSQSKRLAEDSGNRMTYGEVKKQEFARCLKSLESRPQWWTSYSNSRQNAVMMCQAARNEIEKGGSMIRIYELLDLHKAMAGVTTDLSSTLATTLRNANAHLVEQKAFAEAVGVFRSQLIHDLEGATTKAQAFFGSVVRDLDSVLQAVVGKLFRASKSASDETNALSQRIRESKDDVASLRKDVGRVFQEVLRGSSELAATQTKDLEFNHEVTIAIQRSLETIQGQNLQQLFLTFGSIHSELQSSNELVSLMHTRQTALDERLLNLDHSFRGLETKANAFQASQVVHAENQKHLYESLRTEMQIAHGLIKGVSTSAANLHSLIDEASAKVKKMGFLTGLGGTAGQLSWAIIVLIGIGMVSGKVAGCVAIGVCATVAIITSGLPTFLSHNVKPDIALPYSSATGGEHESSATVMFVVTAASIAVVLCIASMALRGTSALSLNEPSVTMPSKPGMMHSV
ncbi:MAG: hypothetical protein M1827_007666 [Pycnora praestabilis]|nr:MAG: hypothetical protein M1827_007666 [Pycnora praestabilis]